MSTPETHVPFFDLHRLYLEQKAEIDAAALGALGSGHYILGPRGKAFEEAMAASLGGSGQVIGCNSGTDALVLPLRAAGVGARRGAAPPEAEVITVAHTAIPTITAIRASGGTPVFVDVDADTWLLDAKKALAAVTERTRAIIVVHLYGAMGPVDELVEGLKKMGRADVAVIEDCAQAQGASKHGRAAGTLARFGSFSFYPTKNVGCIGDGGAVHAGDPADAERLRWLRNYGQKDRYNAQVEGGMNSRLDEVQAAILSVRLPKLREWNARKETMVARYRRELGGLPLTFQKVAEGVVPAWHLCVVATDAGPTRDRLQAELTGRGVQTLIHYPHPAHTQPAFAPYRREALPVTESLAARILSLPMNPTLSQKEQDLVIRSVKEFFR
ncbi:MAG: DegT/DnrJ/EryC1/StrS family aminotransferase [Deltaproteobacteria bacterium]|nr:DegT/DnrJ/EryC1/StrS family aminotransferase [Deltaproteobacteria bacterium]